MKQDVKRKNIIRELSSCIFEKFNDFNIVRLEFDRKLRQKITPRLTKMKKLGMEQLFSVISVLITTEEKINSIDVSKTAQVNRVTYTILTCRIC